MPERCPKFFALTSILYLEGSSVEKPTDKCPCANTCNGDCVFEQEKDPAEVSADPAADN